MVAEKDRSLIETDFKDIDVEQLVDVSRIRIDRELPLEERRKQYVRNVGNPYMVRVGEMKVKIGFAGQISFDEAFENLLMSI